MTYFSRLTIQELLENRVHKCACGKSHSTELEYAVIEPGAVNRLPEALAKLSAKKPFIVCDHNTYKIAGEKSCRILNQAGVDYRLFEFQPTPLKMEPDEMAVGAMTMAFDASCDVVVAVGSGVVNDCCKVLATTAKIPQIVVATAPSMDGYASNSSSMIQNHIKVSLYVNCPRIILCDIDIMKEAPMDMLMAGLGDMLAKYISICEWRISNLVTGEYYCENIAGLMRSSLVKCWNMADELISRDAKAVAAVSEGLVLSGIAMSYAQISRPASGLEHYFSHLWEMMALSRGQESQLHGIQVGVGTVIALFIMDMLKNILPDRRIANKFMAAFRQEEWENEVNDIFGTIAPTIIKAEEKFLLNDPQRHTRRLDKIIAHWAEIVQIMEDELPPKKEILEKMRQLCMPHSPKDLGINLEDTRRAFIGSRVIRDKYLSSSLIWDLGLINHFADLLIDSY